MIFGADLANLLLYCAQQLGVTLGVGAETIMLAAYLISMRDGIVDEKETQYAHAIKRVLLTSLGLIIVSGISITVLHLMLGESAVIFTSAFLFKWLLVVAILILTSIRRSYPTSIVEGVIGGTWYALFLVHIFAPAVGWVNLFEIFAVWILGFVICFEVITRIYKDKKKLKENPLPATQSPVAPIPPPAPKPIPPPIKPKENIVLAPDLPHKAPETVVAPPLAQVVAAVASIDLPTPAPPITPVPLIKVDPKISLAQVSPFDSVTPLPAGKVTDTPFLPAVPALQPIPTIVAPSDGAPVSPLDPKVFTHAPALSTSPGGTSSGSGTPLVQEGLSAMNIMPKNPALANKK